MLRYMFPEIHSGVTPANLLVASMAAEPSLPHTCILFVTLEIFCQIFTLATNAVWPFLVFRKYLPTPPPAVPFDTPIWIHRLTHDMIFVK